MRNEMKIYLYIFPCVGVDMLEFPLHLVLFGLCFFRYFHSINRSGKCLQSATATHRVYLRMQKTF